MSTGSRGIVSEGEHRNGNEDLITTLDCAGYMGRKGQRVSGPNSFTKLCFMAIPFMTCLSSSLLTLNNMNVWWFNF